MIVAEFNSRNRRGEPEQYEGVKSSLDERMVPLRPSKHDWVTPKRALKL